MRHTTAARELILIRKVWANIKDRCLNPRSHNWDNYGGRGITISSDWLRFETFYQDMGARFPGASIERIDNNAGYSKENCKWATATEQAQNRRPYFTKRNPGEYSTGKDILIDTSWYTKQADFIQVRIRQYLERKSTSTSRRRDIIKTSLGIG